MRRRLNFEGGILRNGYVIFKIPPKKFHLAQRLHVHILSRAPLRAGDVFQPGRSQAETELTR